MSWGWLCPLDLNKAFCANGMVATSGAIYVWRIVLSQRKRCDVIIMLGCEKGWQMKGRAHEETDWTFDGAAVDECLRISRRFLGGSLAALMMMR